MMRGVSPNSELYYTENNIVAIIVDVTLNL